MPFEFLDLDHIPGEEIDLLIDEKAPANDAVGWVPAYKYHIVLHGSTTVVGTIDVRIGYQESLYFGGHIGYTVWEQYRGYHYAGKACQLVKQVALAHGMKTLFITCNPGNVPSRKTCEYIGAELLEIVDLPPHNEMYIEGDRQKCIFEWVLTHRGEDLRGSVADNCVPTKDWS